MGAGGRGGDGTGPVPLWDGEEGENSDAGPEGEGGGGDDGEAVGREDSVAYDGEGAVGHGDYGVDDDRGPDLEEEEEEE